MSPLVSYGVSVVLRIGDVSSPVDCSHLSHHTLLPRTHCWSPSSKNKYISSLCVYEGWHHSLIFQALMFTVWDWCLGRLSHHPRFALTFTGHYWLLPSGDEPIKEPPCWAEIKSASEGWRVITEDLSFRQIQLHWTSWTSVSLCECVLIQAHLSHIRGQVFKIKTNITDPHKNVLTKPKYE